jgi:benzylsuccinate CoA-transferase BbsE subunit
MAPPGKGALSGLKVVEIAGVMTPYCGKLFADLGAEVILVEPPGGAASRDMPPFIEGDRSDRRSLAFSYFNAGKRSVILDLDDTSGQAALAALVDASDMLLESEAPGYLADRGLSFEALSAHTPRLVYTSITPFGQTGPYAGFKAHDLTLLALGGLLSLAGFSDSAPTRVWGNQAILAAAQFAAAGSLAAILHAEQHGQGQRVDVSAQQCVVMGLENAVQFADLEGTVRKRAGGAVRFAGTGIFSCQDGEVFVMAAGVGEPRFWQCTVAWLRDEGVEAVEEIADDKWRDFRFLAKDEAKAVFRRIFTPFAATRTLDYLFHEGQRRGVPIVPVASPSDVMNNEQLKSRHFFAPFVHPSPKAVDAAMPGVPYALSATPGQPGGPVPTAGEHTAPVFAELGYGPDAIETLRRQEAI